MSFEYHHLDKFGFANLDLCEEMLESEKKAIVLISGASSSGKSFSAELLKDLLDHNGHHAVIVSLDQYDYGLSGIIPNKVALNDFQNHLGNLSEIEKRIKDIIIDLPFEKKYDDETISLIKSKIQDLLSPADLERFAQGLKREWVLLNFDEPSVYALPEAAEDIKTLSENGKIHEKSYSKLISERIPNATILDGKDYDVILV